MFKSDIECIFTLSIRPVRVGTASEQYLCGFRSRVGINGNGEWGCSCVVVRVDINPGVNQHLNARPLVILNRFTNVPTEGQCFLTAREQKTKGKDDQDAAA